MIIVNGAAPIYTLKPVVCKTFDDYAAKIFLSYIETKLDRADRMEIVWDQYLENRIKFEIKNAPEKGSNARLKGAIPYLVTGSSLAD